MSQPHHLARCNPTTSTIARLIPKRLCKCLLRLMQLLSTKLSMVSLQMSRRKITVSIGKPEY
eukprot:6475988-Amphidinium_carterae.3